ncbi:hypothetical protein M7I_5029 [Glarea lozoyensis 74030]|uniref:Uncharacterized protein n=1 Tax=Glarea lozoyensis (strain ATCC 74030 / MF5533) TaxID=1104152 RepID=H0EQS4_GLAL7|nr:hypothetical protein M7I_5029 [Glarea lozoyensis 74030]
MVRTQLRPVGIQACKLLRRCLTEVGLAFAASGIGPTAHLPQLSTNPKKNAAATPEKWEIYVSRGFGNTPDEDEE